jgi:hypothetical protein
LEITKDEIDSGISVICNLAEEIDKIRLKVLDAKELPINTEACGAYDGCPYQQHCKLSIMDKVRATMAQTEKKMTLGEKMRARTLNRDEPAETPRTIAFNPPEAPTEDEAEEAEPQVNGKKAKKLAPPRVDAPVVEEPVRSRGRPAGSKNAVKTETPAAPAPAAAPAAPAAAPAAPAAAPAAPAAAPAAPAAAPVLTKNAAPMAAISTDAFGFLLLHAAALAGGGHQHQLVAARTLWEEFLAIQKGMPS